ELTTGLDTKARRDVWNILEKLKKQGLSILLTSHYMDEIEALCDEILILKKGKTVFYGTLEEAKLKSGKNHFEDAYLWYTDEEDSYENI
ncbi:MAG: ABC transporter ATP-binding protein, partial [Lachnospiraceae bacterium]